MDTRLDSMLTTQDVLAALVVEASDELLDFAPDEQWTARTVLAHLRDHEYLSMRPALERALAEDVPEIYFIEDAEWAARHDPTHETREQLLAAFALQRRTSLSILRALRPQEWQRGIRHTTLGAFTIDRLVDLWLEHDARHIAQIEALVGETVPEVVGRNAQLLR
ncbi:MAG: DinB family protein [Tepidiformaceae bacterium]